MIAPGAWLGVLGGGQLNVVDAFASVGLGGNFNKVQSNYATILGGYRNKIDARFSAVAGGGKNTVNGRFAYAAGYRAKVTADYGAAFALTDDSCEARGLNVIAFCVNGFNVKDAGGKWQDVLGLFDSRARQLAEAEDHAKVSAELTTADATHAKVNGEQRELVDSFQKRTAESVERLSALSYEAALKQADALIARLS